MSEHGLGVPRNYELAWAYYDRARDSGYADRSDVDQGLDGMPIELLTFFAKGRYYIRTEWRRGVGSLFRLNQKNNQGLQQTSPTPTYVLKEGHTESC